MGNGFLGDEAESKARLPTYTGHSCERKLPRLSSSERDARLPPRPPSVCSRYHGCCHGVAYRCQLFPRHPRVLAITCCPSGWNQPSLSFLNSLDPDQHVSIVVGCFLGTLSLTICHVPVIPTVLNSPTSTHL